nr:hypothetical protein [Mucilaginibacter sp. E4BP6]
MGAGTNKISLPFSWEAYWVSYGTDFEPVYSGFTENSKNLETSMVRISNQPFY